METTQPKRTRDRLPGAVLIIAAAIMFTGAAIGFLAPSLSEAPPFVTDDVERVAAAIAANPTAWRWANGLILAAAILTALALVPISLRFEGPGRPWAWTGLTAFVFAAVFAAIDRIISMQVTTWAAQQYPDATVFTVWDAFERFGGGLGVTFYILGFLALGLYGIAMAQAERTRGLGWAFVASSLLGIALEVIGGAGIPAYVFLGTAALGVATWQLGDPQRTTRRAANHEPTRDIA